MPPDFLAVGHVVRDLQPWGWRLGGTVTFAAVQAQRLGLSAAVVTRLAPEIDLARELPEIEVSALSSAATTTFQNIYYNSERQQVVLQQADVLVPADIPAGWRGTPIVLLGPVCGELAGVAGPLFTNSRVGVSAQGWLREIGPDKRVRRVPWTGGQFWAGCDALFVSEEDLGDHPEQVDLWLGEVAVVAVTRAGRGARLFEDGRSRAIDGFPAVERDPTGAGDVFAAAFLVRYHESREIETAARFASAAAACSVEATGIDAIARRDQIEDRMSSHPEIVLT